MKETILSMQVLSFALSLSLYKMFLSLIHTYAEGPRGISSQSATKSTGIACADRKNQGHCILMSPRIGINSDRNFYRRTKIGRLQLHCSKNNAWVHL